MVWTKGGNDNFGFGAGKTWLPIDARHAHHTVSEMESRPDSILHFYRQALALRRATPALRYGELTFIGDDDLLIIRRRAEGETRLCFYNLTDRALALPADMRLGAIDIRVGEAVNDGKLPAFSGFIVRA